MSQGSDVEAENTLIDGSKYSVRTCKGITVCILHVFDMTWKAIRLYHQCKREFKPSFKRKPC